MRALLRYVVARCRERRERDLWREYAGECLRSTATGTAPRDPWHEARARLWARPAPQRDPEDIVARVAAALEA